MATKSSGKTQTLAQSKTPPTKRKTPVRTLPPVPNKETAKLLNDVRKYCRKHDIPANMLARDAGITVKSACNVLDGSCRYLKSKSTNSLKGWLDAALKLEPDVEPSGPYYPEPEVEPVPVPEVQQQLPLVDPIANDAELQDLKLRVKKLETLVSDLSHTLVLVQAKLL